MLVDAAVAVAIDDLKQLRAREGRARGDAAWPRARPAARAVRRTALAGEGRTCSNSLSDTSRGSSKSSCTSEYLRARATARHQGAHGARPRARGARARKGRSAHFWSASETSAREAVPSRSASIRRNAARTAVRK